MADTLRDVARNTARPCGGYAPKTALSEVLMKRYEEPCDPSDVVDQLVARGAINIKNTTTEKGV